MEHLDLKAWGEQLHKTIKHATGMPVSIGIGPTKTLAKMASHYAKHYAGYNHCCYIDTDEKRIKALKLYPIDEVWGIGRQYTKRLQAVDRRSVGHWQTIHQTTAGCGCADGLRLRFLDEKLGSAFVQCGGGAHVARAERRRLCATGGYEQEEEHLHQQKLPQHGFRL